MRHLCQVHCVIIIGCCLALIACTYYQDHGDSKKKTFQMVCHEWVLSHLKTWYVGTQTSNVLIYQLLF